MTISTDDDGRASPPVAPLVPPPPATRPRLARASIVTPGDWIELDLNPTTRHTSISRLVRRALVHSRGLASDAVALIALLDRTCRQAVDAGAFYCASRVIKDASGNSVVMTVLMQIRPSVITPLLDVLPEMSSLSASERCASLAQAIGNDPWWAGTSIRVVPLSFVGPAVRLHIEDGGVIVQYLVPLVDGSADVVLSFSCAFPPYARLMTDLFDVMAQSLELQYE
jgi:hypothetical protein